MSAALWTVIGSLAAVLSAGVATWQVLERRRSPVTADKAAESGHAGLLADTPATATTERREVPEDERRCELGRELRNSRLGRGISQEQLASLLPNDNGGVGVEASWLDRVETQDTTKRLADETHPDVALPSRAQLIAWARECALDDDRLLDRAKQLLPEVYPPRFIPRPSPYSATALPQSLKSRDWHQDGLADATETVGIVISLLQASAGTSNSVDMTFSGPLLRALAHVAGNGTALDPLMRSLAQLLEEGATVRQIWSVQAQSTDGPDWLRLLRDLLTLSGLPGSYRVLASSHSEHQTTDVVAAGGLGGVLILEQPEGFLAVSVSGDKYSNGISGYFQVLMHRRQSTDLLKVSDWAASPDVLVDWENAMAEADEAPGWRMLIQPYLGDATCPAAVKAQLLDRWRASCSDPAKVELSYQFEQACGRRRRGLELSLKNYECFDVASGPAFDRFVDHGYIQTRWGAETPAERLQHLSHLLDLLESKNYNLVIVKRTHDMYPEIFGQDSGADDDRGLYCLLKERGSDYPSVFTSTYFYPHQSRSFEIRHPLIFDEYRKQGRAILTNLAAEISDKANVISEIKRAMERIARMP